MMTAPTPATQPTQTTNGTNGTVKAAERTKPQRALATLRPRVDIYENEREFLLVADVPGVSPETLTVKFERGELSFEGSQPDNVARGRYVRVFSIPDTVDSGKIEAHLDAGVLRLHLPKMESAKPRQIAVRGA
ncbi:MAG: Hsp20/alpha crystallin family protein [Polyangiaceae bacterium]